MEDILILVDENDRPVGLAGKTEVHEKGLLHRAFSIFIFNSQGEMLLQKRAKSKYHSGGLWTNACCGHPLQGETLEAAAHRRLKVEMNIETTLEEIGVFHYTCTFENGLTENEVDHVFYGVTNQLPQPNPAEADDWKYIRTSALLEEINASPENFTEWFKIAIATDILSSRLQSELQ